MRLVHAARILGQVVARERERARARPAADLLVFAEAALPAALRGVAQRLEQLGIAIDVGQRIVEDVAAGDRQEAAGEDLARVRHEDETLAVADARGPPRDALGVLVLRDAVLRLHALRHVAAIVHRLGGLDAERRGLREVVHELEHLLVLVGASRSSPSSARPVTIRKKRLHIFVRTSFAISAISGSRAHIAPRDRGLELRVEADIAGVAQREHGALERAGDAAEIVVAGGVGTVQADRHARDAGFLELVDRFRGEQRRGARASRWCAGRFSPRTGSARRGRAASADRRR